MASAGLHAGMPASVACIQVCMRACLPNMACMHACTHAVLRCIHPYIHSYNPTPSTTGGVGKEHRHLDGASGPGTHMYIYIYICRLSACLSGCPSACLSSAVGAHSICSHNPGSASCAQPGCGSAGPRQAAPMFMFLGMMRLVWQQQTSWSQE